MSKLKGIKKTQIKTPPRILVYSAEGLGKSTLGASAPDAIMFDIEGGSTHLEVARYPFSDRDDGYIPKTYEDVLVGIDDLLESEHEYKTVVIDTIDALEPMIWNLICRRESGKQSNFNKNGDTLTSIDAFPYGKGYTLALDEWRSLCWKLDQLRTKRGMAVVLLGHSQIEVYKNPLGEDFDRYGLRIHKKSGGYLKEYCDVVGYLAHEQFAGVLLEETGKRNARPKGMSTDRRLLHFKRCAAFDAKTRLPLPAQVELKIEDPWKEFAKALSLTTNPKKLRGMIDAELDRLCDGDLTEKVVMAVDFARNDASTLARYLNDLKARTPKENQ